MTSLIPPLGGRLVDLIAVADERRALVAEAASLPAVQLSPRSLCDLELLATGAFSPLDRFMGEDDYLAVLSDMRLAGGTVFPIPITLPVDDDSPIGLGSRLALRAPTNDLLAVMTVDEVFAWDRRDEAARVLGTCDLRHPLVAEMATWGTRYVSGPLRVVALPRHYDFGNLRATPAEVRTALEKRGYRHVVAFQTRNPLHRAHEELTKRAAASIGGTLLIHPVVGLTKPGDIDHYTRVRACRAVVERYFDPGRTLLRLLPLAMRMAGPREAVWHALVRRNYGASHFIVGRDHAGPGLDSHGRPFYMPYEAQELLEKLGPEIGVRTIPFEELLYVPDAGTYEAARAVPAGVRTLSLSGTQVRQDYLARGRALPEWFTRPETAAILRTLSPPTHQQGFCVWFTGLSGAGKSTIAEVLTVLLLERGRRVTILDGDVVRTHLSRGLGFSREDRDTNVRRIGFVAAEVVRHQGVAVCAAVSPYEAARNECRRMVGADHFVLIHVSTPLEVCEARDTKGMYARARRGELRGFTGIDDPYERPDAPDIELTTTDATPEESARSIVRFLERRGLLLEDPD